MLEKDAAVLTEVTNAIKEVKSTGKCNKDILSERPDEFPADAMSFCSITAMIMEQAEDLFAVTRCADRFSRQYLKLCKTLEKTVDHLGSSYITKEAMKVKHFDISLIETLSANRLYEMISLNFRKCDAALNQIKLTRQEFDADLFNQMLSFANTMERLRVTEDRVYDINHGFKDASACIKGVYSFTDLNGDPRPDKKNRNAAPFRSSPSYAIRHEVLADAEAHEKRSGNRNWENNDHTGSEIPDDATTVSEIIEAEIVSECFTPEADAAETEPKGIPDGSAAVSEDPEQGCTAPEEKAGGITLSTEPPEYYGIIKQAMERSCGAEDESILFTEAEMNRLLADPLFCRMEPDLAEAFRSYLSEPDSG